MIHVLIYPNWVCKNRFCATYNKTMKYIVTLFLGFITIISYGQNKDYIESVLLDCIKNSYNEVQINLNKELNLLEDHLIDLGILKSNTGKSYYNFFMDVAKRNRMPEIKDIDKFTNLNKIGHDEYYSDKCLGELTKIDSVERWNSKYIKLQIKTKAVALTEGVSPTSIATVITSLLTPADFKIPYYRALALLAVAHTSGFYSIHQEPKVVKFHETSDYESVLIHINKNDEIIYNSEIIDQASLTTELYKFIKRKEAKHLILFSNEKETTYRFFLIVQNCISEVYSQLREEKSNELYEKSLSELIENEKENIFKLYPKNIKEI